VSDPTSVTCLLGELLRRPSRHPAPVLLLATDDDGSRVATALDRWAGSARPAPRAVLGPLDAAAGRGPGSDVAGAMESVRRRWEATSGPLRLTRWRRLDAALATPDAAPGTLAGALLDDVRAAYRRRPDRWGRAVRPLLVVDGRSGAAGVELVTALLAAREARDAALDPVVLAVTGDGWGGLLEGDGSPGRVVLGPCSPADLAAVAAAPATTGLVWVDARGAADFADLLARQLGPGHRATPSVRTVRAASAAAALLLVGAGTAGGVSLAAPPDGSPSTSAAPDGSCPANAPGVALSLDAQGECIGLTDSPRFGFGRKADPSTQAAMLAVLGGNRPIDARRDLTVIWLGALTCRSEPVFGQACVDRPYLAELQDMQALGYAQGAATGTTQSPRLHLVVANAGQDVAHAGDVAATIVARYRAGALGSRAVVVGVGDSRTVTRQAIGTLLDAGIPVLTGTLTADPDRPGRPFVDRPGYLQLSPPADQYASDTVQLLAPYLGSARATAARHGGPALIIYQQPLADGVTPDADDLFSVSQTRDTERAAADAHLVTRASSSLSELSRAACPQGDGSGRAVFFAGRWSRFRQFAQALGAACLVPPAVWSNDSVNRFMNNDTLRAGLGDIGWPLRYYSAGPQCTDLLPSAAGVEPPLEARTLLARMRRTDPTTCAAPDSQVGSHVTVLWDVVRLAGRLAAQLPLGPADLDRLALPTTALAEGSVTIAGGQVDRPVPLRPLCVLHIAQGPRSSGVCPTAFKDVYAAAPGRR